MQETVLKQYKQFEVSKWKVYKYKNIFPDNDTDL